MKKWILVSFFAFSILVGVFLRFGPGLPGSKVRGVSEIDWRNLSELDYMTHIASNDLKRHDNTRVRIPGFMVPLEDNARKVIEFLLVPTPQACIHVPAPPPNQMVYVKMNEGVNAAFGPIWVYGTFKIVTKTSQYGDASFELLADFIEPYE